MTLTFCRAEGPAGSRSEDCVGYDGHIVEEAGIEVRVNGQDEGSRSSYTTVESGTYCCRL